MFRKITLIIEDFSLHLIWLLKSIQQRVEDLTGVASLAPELYKLWILIPEYIHQCLLKESQGQ